MYFTFLDKNMLTKMKKRIVKKTKAIKKYASPLKSSFFFSLK